MKSAGWAGRVDSVGVAAGAVAVAHVRVGDVALGGGEAGRGGRGNIEEARVPLGHKRAPVKYFFFRLLNFNQVKYFLSDYLGLHQAI